MFISYASMHLRQLCHKYQCGCGRIGVRIPRTPMPKLFLPAPDLSDANGVSNRMTPRYASLRWSSGNGVVIPLCCA